MGVLNTDASGAPRAPTRHEEFAARLYDAPATNTSEEFYPLENAIKTELDANLTALEDRLGLTPSEQAAERQNFLAMMRATNLDEDVRTAVVLHNAWTGARLAATRPDGDDRDHELELADMNEQTRQEVRLRYGADAHPLMERTQKFVKQHPLLAEIVGTGSVGSRQDVVEALMQHVRRHGLGR